VGKNMGLKLIDQIEDSLEDEIGLCLRRLHATPTWTTVKSELFEQLMGLAKRERYMRFTGDFRDYHLERKGQSCLYDVPLGQRGALKKFRGKRIRLICAGAWDQYAGRFFLAKTIRVEFKTSLSARRQVQT
jgi:hypothetical protein